MNYSDKSLRGLPLFANSEKDVAIHLKKKNHPLSSVCFSFQPVIYRLLWVNGTIYSSSLSSQNLQTGKQLTPRHSHSGWRNEILRLGHGSGAVKLQSELCFAGHFC